MAGDWVSLDLSAAAFFNFGGNLTGHYDGAGIVSDGGNYPEFAFPGVILDPGTSYDVEATYDDNGGGTDLYIYGLPGTTQADYDASPYFAFYGGEAYTGELVSVYSIGPGINDWGANVAIGNMHPHFASDPSERLVSLRYRVAVAPEPAEDVTGQWGVSAPLAAGETATYTLASPIDGNLIFWVRDPGSDITVTNTTTGLTYNDYPITHGHETAERPGPGRSANVAVSVDDALTITLSASIAATHELRWQSLTAGLGEYVPAPDLTDVQPLVSYDYGTEYGYEIGGSGVGPSISEAIAAAVADLREKIGAGADVGLSTLWHGTREAELGLSVTKVRINDYSSWRIAPDGLPTVPDGLTVEEMWTGPSVVKGGQVSLDPAVDPVIVHGTNGGESYTLGFRFGFADPDFQPVVASGTVYGGSAYGPISGAAALAVQATMSNGELTGATEEGSFHVAEWGALAGSDGFVRVASWSVVPYPEIPVPSEADFSNSVFASFNRDAVVLTFAIEQGDVLRYAYHLAPAPERTYIRRPLRLHPRSDGLGMSGVRRYGTNSRSVQASLRRGGGTYI